MKIKYIFDLDGTLLEGDFSKEKDYFESVLSASDSKIFIPKIHNLLEKYESIYQRYDIDLLSEFMRHESSVKITPSIIRGWQEFNKDMDNTIIDGVVDTLEELKMHDKQLVVLTNGFSDTQIGRLKKSKIDIYFDEVYGGETYLKPNSKAYLNACGNTPFELCVMIGDDYKKDIEGAISAGVDAIYFDRNNTFIEDKNSVKSLRKIKEMY